MTGCSNETVQLQYVKQPCAKFDYSLFKPKEDIVIKNVTSYKDDNNISFIKQPKVDYIDFIKNYKELKENYNILLNNLKEFNDKESTEQNIIK
jgi:hypothetical protein